MQWKICLRSFAESADRRYVQTLKPNPNILWLIAVILSAGCSKATRDGPVAADLFADVQTVSPGQPFTVAFRMQLDKSWHTYWTNPGDSGLSPVVEWELPEGFTVGEMQIPYPMAISTPPFMTHGHEGEVLYLFTLTPPAELPNGEITLRAQADWLVCKDLCLPGHAALALILPVGAGPSKVDRHRAAKIAAARNLLPADPGGWRFEARQIDGRYQLFAFPPADDWPKIPMARFFAYAPDLIRHAAEQTWLRDGAHFVLELDPANPSAPPPEKLAGVLVAPVPWRATGPWRAIRVEAPFSENPPRLPREERNEP